MCLLYLHTAGYIINYIPKGKEQDREKKQLEINEACKYKNM